MDERLEQAVATLNTLIEQIGGCGLDQSVFFLQMARLQLKLDLNGVTDHEFGAFCDAVENGTLDSPTRLRPGQPRGRPPRGPGRVRPGADEIALRRVGRRRAGQ
ncbi:MAG: hypothetical protein E6G97_10745 [Alphaproteobacteria bacterium]|nr:MAG: hypothetical protein E6G97_10745 [Alphaproteobacteria bacterium]